MAISSANVLTNTTAAMIRVRGDRMVRRSFDAGLTKPTPTSLSDLAVTGTFPAFFGIL